MLKFVEQIPSEYGTPVGMCVWDNIIYIATDTGKLISLSIHAAGKTGLEEVAVGKEIVEERQGEHALLMAAEREKHRGEILDMESFFMEQRKVIEELPPLVEEQAQVVEELPPLVEEPPQ